MELNKGIRINIDDISLKRKRGGNCLNRVYMNKLNIQDLIINEINIYNNDYPDKRIELFYDNLIKIKININDKTLFDGDFYDIEKMYQNDPYQFYNLLRHF